MRIRELREAAGLTQTALALRVGVSRQAVNQWELGTTWPSSQLLPVLAATLGCKIEGLYDEEDRRRAVSLWKNGVNWPGSQVLPALAAALGCEISALYDPGKDVPDPDTRQD